jgi:hypothetical protein
MPRILVLLCLVGVLLFGMSCSVYRGVFSPELELPISGPITVSSAWSEIVPAKPLKAERQENAVMFDFATVLNEKDLVTENGVAKWGIRFPDGSVVMPEVQLIGQDGKAYPLTPDFFDSKGVGFDMTDPSTHLDSLPRDKKFRAVRVRCPKSIRFSRVYWYSFNQSDRK